ncbi:MAG TPA: sensor domain-containing diguanylate cyclase [candidate division Zixibacteria bacterium]|jgi:diguanylate cyclase (GGDEF)-like protein
MRIASIPYWESYARVERLYWFLRVLVFAGVALNINPLSDTLAVPWYRWAIPSGYALSLVLPPLLQRIPSVGFAAIFWPVLAFDVTVISAVSHFAGSGTHDLFVLYYVLVAFVGYHLDFVTAICVAFGMAVVYAVPPMLTHGAFQPTQMVFRGAVLCAFAGAMSMAARSARTSTDRLLNAMDKLNERTTELERSHAQLQTIYETSRSLAHMLAEQSVIERVLHIARSVLNYPVCEIYTWDQVSGKLRLKGRVDGPTTRRYDRAPTVPMTPNFQRAINKQEIARVVDRNLGRTVVDGTPHRSQLVAPMMTEGKVIGLLNAESPNINAFSDRDERVFSILAASTALALKNADLHRQMEKLTIEDELTRVFNFRYFRSRLEDERRRAVRYGQPLSLIMVDIDWFKQLNDRHGHQIGNIALCQLASVIGACIRDVDILARYGGEEFIVILPQTGTDEARSIGERIRHKVEQTEFGPDAAERPIRITVSVGVSCFPESGGSEENLVESVDQALYRAKDAGKNSVRLYEAGFTMPAGASRPTHTAH